MFCSSPGSTHEHVDDSIREFLRTPNNYAHWKFYQAWQELIKKLEENIKKMLGRGRLLKHVWFEQKRVSQSIILINTSRNVLFNVPLTAVSYAEGKYSIYCTVPSPRLQVFKNATSFPLFLPLWVHECRECKNADEEAKVTAQCIKKSRSHLLQHLRHLVVPCILPS